MSHSKIATANPLMGVMFLIESGITSTLQVLAIKMLVHKVFFHYTDVLQFKSIKFVRTVLKFLNHSCISKYLKQMQYGR